MISTRRVFQPYPTTLRQNIGWWV